jgi:hypothetical protein
MTDRADLPEPPDVDADVELASALLDEEASSDERARADDPAVQAHVATLGAVSARVGEVPPVPDGLLDRHVAAALDAFDEPATDTAVVPIDTRRAGGRTWWQRAPLGAVAAVVAVVALVGAVGLASMGGGDADDTATTAFDEPGDGGGGDTADDSEAFSATEESADLGAGGGTAGSAERALASYADLDELADDLAARNRLRQESDADADDAGTAAPTADAAAPAAGTTSEQSEPAPCDAVAVAGLEPDEVIEIVPALVDGTPVTAVVHGDPDAPRLAVVDDGSCQVLVDRDLPDGG